MAVRIVSLLAKIGLDGKAFQQGLRNLDAQTKKFAESLGTRLGAGFGAIAAAQAIRAIAEQVGRIKDLSEQFGVTTDEVQRLDFAAKQSGQTFEDIGTAVEKLGAARQKALEGNEDMIAQFARFGVVLDDLANPANRNVDLLSQMANAISKMNLKASDTQALRDLFGKSGARLAAVFADLENVKIQPITEEAIKNIDDATKALERLKLEAQSIGAAGLSEATGGKSLMDGLRRVLRLLVSPELLAGELVGQRLHQLANPASANNPIGRSSEMVGPPTVDQAARSGERVGPPMPERAAAALAEVFQRQAEFANNLARTQFQQVGAFTGIAAGALTSSIDRNVDSMAKDIHSVKAILQQIANKQPAQKAFFG